MPKSRKLVLPKLNLTYVSNVEELDDVRLANIVPQYETKPLVVETASKRRDGKPLWAPYCFNRFPLVIDKDGAPWAEATLFILFKLEEQYAPNMTTVSIIADDLAHFRRFLEEYDLEWMHFPKNKLHRVTYRFNGHLKHLVYAGEIALSTARRRMSSVISFYRWLIKETAINPENSPWKDSDRYVQFKGRYGSSVVKKIISTDISICMPRQDDPYDKSIVDGGKLRPLPTNEQKWLHDALSFLDNPEMTLIHVFSLLTGARMQTVLTFRVRHTLIDLNGLTLTSDIPFSVGPGTGIDTKNDKFMNIYIPVWFYRLLRIYALSDRSIKRRLFTKGGNHEGQYLFLSRRGKPMYESKEDASVFDEENALCYKSSGQSVRQFIRDHVIPYIQKNYDAPKFHYRFHDLRATAGMNWTEHQLALVEKKLVTLHDAREFIKTRMCHQSSVTTDLYLNYRDKEMLVRWAEKQHEEHLQMLANKAINNIE